MNSKAAFFFAILLLVHLTFGLLLLLFSRIHGRKELKYMSSALLLKAVLSIGPTLMIFQLDVSWSSYLTGIVKVSLLPLTFLYFSKLSRKKKSLVKSDLYHFIPAVINLLLTLIILPGHASEIAPAPDETLHATVKMIWPGNWRHNTLAITCRIMCFAQAFLYSILVFRLYKKYIQRVKENESLLIHQNTIWMKWAVVIFTFQGFFEGFALLGIYHFKIVFILSFAFQIIYAFFFVVHASIQKDLASFFHPPHSSEKAVLQNGTSQMVLESFQKQKLYLRPEISLDEAARHLDISVRELSHLVKTAGYPNFYSFVNAHRIAHSKQLLSVKPDHLVIESVIEESGFKSRATFYRVFKQATGITPSQFIAEIRNSH